MNTDTIFVILAIILIASLTLMTYHIFRFYYQTQIIEFFFIGSFFLIAALSNAFIVIANRYNELILYQIERIFLIITYWFLLLLISRITEKTRFVTLAITILWTYSIILVVLILFWEKGIQSDRAEVFGIEIDYIENVPYHPNGARLTIDSLNLTYGTSFPLLNTAYMLIVTLFLFYAFSKITLPVQNYRTNRAKTLWLLATGSHFVWIVLALPWLNLAGTLYLMNIGSAICFITIIFFYPEGLILSKSQILSAYGLYDKLVVLKKDTKDLRITNYTIEQIVNYIDLIPSMYLKTIES